MTRRGRALLLGSLYLAQGLPYGFYTQALPLLLRDQGVVLARVTAMTAALALPWALKFLWAPLVDRVGQRRSWILPLQAASTLVLLGLAALDFAADPMPALWGFALLNLLCATQDIATDGLAVVLVPPGERGLANGLQVAAYRVGMVLAGGPLLVLYDRLGWTPALLLLAGVNAAATLPILWATEPPAPPPAPAAGSALLDFFRRPRALPWIGLLAVYKLGEALGVSALRFVLQDQGYGLDQIGWIIGTAGFGAGLLGALLGGVLVNPLGRTRALTLLGGLQALCVGAYALLPGLPVEAVALLVIAEHLASGMATAALFTRMMDACRPAQAGGDYTLQASVVVIASGVAQAVSGASLAALGPVAHFLLAAALAALALLPAARLRPPDP